MSESIEFGENAGFRDVERGLCSSGTTCTIRATVEIASPYRQLEFGGGV